MIKENFYCCYDCYINDKMNSEGYLYKFNTSHKNEDYFFFLQLNDAVKEMIVEFLIVILGVEYDISKNYGDQIWYGGKSLPHNKAIKVAFSTKNHNHVHFILPSKIQSRSGRRKVSTTVDNRKSITSGNKTISINDSDDKQDHYLTSWHESSDTKKTTYLLSLLY